MSVFTPLLYIALQSCIIIVIHYITVLHYVRPLRIHMDLRHTNTILTD